jgi:hypothetical protein
VFRGKKIMTDKCPPFLWTNDSLILWAENPGLKKKSFALELDVQY